MLNALKRIYEVCSQGYWVWGIGIALLLVVWKAIYKEFYGKASLLGCLKDIWVRAKDVALGSAKCELSGVPIPFRIVAIAIYSVASYIMDLVLFDQNKLVAIVCAFLCFAVVEPMGANLFPAFLEIQNDLCSGFEQVMSLVECEVFLDSSWLF